jgi:D-amino peptidase
VTKYSLSRYAARCVPLSESRARIRAAAKRATAKAQTLKPMTYAAPITMAIEFLDREIAYTVSWMPATVYDGNRCVSYTADNFLAIHEFLLAAFWIAASRLNP